VLGGQEESIQNGEPLRGQLLFARRLMYLRHRQSLITFRGHSRTLAQARIYSPDALRES
jgi:hypothetical protein